ncbi:MAG: matrixin family metalloprotease [Geminocystis sp.]|nr:matrixin family metalloprotease [Geminocystis sp.]HIK36953.1 matrixin family metalloprotease [Geminocystis sp. M7585_C2015_104]MCS7148135.1 matrixin family metalloprotease [Geminocystis sp.]MCX8078088.1 matrixin family metalloprotease [Geminocystis sp.]MDW8116486.1 matrixin family metalloprotease [Geminocystis sp.]
MLRELQWFKRRFSLLFLSVLVCLLVTVSQKTWPRGDEVSLPPLKPHPLPPTLAAWQSDYKEDYFDYLQSHPVGALIWYDFPVRVYLESPPDNLSPSGAKAFQQWRQAGKKAIAAWNPYIPLQETNNPEKADILIYRQPPPVGRLRVNPETGLFDLPRVAAATTTVQFYLRDSQLRHKMIIRVNPNQNLDYLESNITHELGHALGIWGHSPSPQDIMYHAHTRDIPTISVRDINTLKRVYQQPTRLGWRLSGN